MANYIGNTLSSGEFKKLDEIASLFDGSTTQFSLKFNSVGITVGDATQLMVSINGVIQEPLVSYTLGTGGSKIVFLSAPPAGASCFITLFGGVGGTTTPSDNSVTSEKLSTTLAADINAKALASDVTSALSLKADQTSVDSSLALKADKSNVLALNNTTAYSPTSNYHPATKGYVDALASSGGGNVSITKGFTFTGDGTTTTFDCGAAGSYILGAVDVYHNGLQLDSTDYNAPDGRYFTLTSLTPAIDDVIKLVAYGGADVYNKTQTDTLLNGKADLGGAAFAGQVTITRNSTISTNDFYASSPTLRLSSSGANTIAGVYFNSEGPSGGRSSGAVYVEPIAQDNWRGNLVNTYTADGAIGSFSIRQFHPANAATYERFKIDSGGRVTHPNQPSFFVRYSNGSYIIQSGDLIFDQAVLNIGGHYSTSTGNFTAPVAGTYWFTAVMQHYGGNGNSSWANIVINGSIYRGLRMEAPATSNYQTNSVSGAVYLNAGDTAKVYCAASNIFWADHTSFSGYLIG